MGTVKHVWFKTIIKSGGTLHVASALGIHGGVKGSPESAASSLRGRTRAKLRSNAHDRKPLTCSWV